MSVASCYVAGELLCRRRAVWQWRAVRRWAVVGCLGGAWHFMVLAQMSQWPTAEGAEKRNPKMALSLMVLICRHNLVQPATLTFDISTTMPSDLVKFCV